jgi:hypothetical protein
LFSRCVPRFEAFAKNMSRFLKPVHLDMFNERVGVG